MSRTITAIVVLPGGERRPTVVSHRTVSPTEIIQIMEQKKAEMQFAWVEEIRFPAGPEGTPTWKGTEDSDALVQMAILAGGSGVRRLSR